ncbi:MAG TPA: SDR family oxidoreductase [Blastocatellia bacterium]|nr:SDR family oxidoreductase [Blastocatellia bacterium]
MSRTILITGSSSGIGRATAEHFQQKGWNVVATMRTPEKAADWARQHSLTLARLDVTDIASIRQAISETLAQFGSIDAIVNNAGYGLVGPFEASTPEQVERQFATNVTGLMNVTREIIPHFRDRRNGVIINVASMGGRITFPLYSVYHGTKWAVEGFTEALLYELQPFNVRVKIIEPGPIKTDFYDRSMDLMKKPGLTAYDSFTAKAMPNMNKAGENAPGPEIVAKTIYRAATDGSWKLRYQANTMGLLTLRRLLPTGLFMSIVRSQVVK